MIKRLILVVAVLGLTFAPVSPVRAGEVHRFVQLGSDKYTNGVEKSFLVGWSFSACSTVHADVEIRFYYDLLNASRIRITKARAKYYLGPSTARMYGGPMSGHGANGSRDIGTLWGDYHIAYLYDPSTRDREGYSYVGTYTHYGPVTIDARHDAQGAKATFTKSELVAYNSTCITDYVDLYLYLRW